MSYSQHEIERYERQAEDDRRNAQIAQEEADTKEGFQRSALLDKAERLRRRAEDYDTFAAQARGER